MHVILLTSTVVPAVKGQLVLVDSSERLAQYVAAIEFYSRTCDGCGIVVCDNSNFDYTPVLKQVKVGLNVECLKYMIDVNEVDSYGKGFGEGHLIEYALSNSEMMRAADSVTKITGRVIVKNINAIIGSIKPPYWYFQRVSYWRSGVDTRIFTFNPKSYQAVLGGAYKDVRDQEGFFLEHAVDRRLRTMEGAWRNYSRYPNFSGASGSTGRSYAETAYKRWVKSLLCFLNLYK